MNKHVTQKKANVSAKAKYVILTAVSKKIGLGHFSRSKTLFREINETITSKVKIICLGKKFIDKDFFYKDRIKFINKISDKLFLEKNKIIIDLPQNLFNNLSNNKINKKNIVIIDNLRNLKKPTFIIPSARKVKVDKKDNVYSGKDILIVSRKILNSISCKKITKKNYLLLSGSSKLSVKIINLLKKEKKIKLILGRLITSSELKILKKMKIKYEINKVNYFENLSNANNVYCKFGLTAYEMILLKKKPIIIEENESNEVKKDIKYLFDKGLIKLIKNNGTISKNKKLNLDINKSLKKIMDIIK